MGDVSGVVVRDATDLSNVCTIASGDMGVVFDAAAMGNGDVIVTTSTGLYHLENPTSGRRNFSYQFHSFTITAHDDGNCMFSRYLIQRHGGSNATTVSCEL